MIEQADRLPPHARNSERAILGSILRDPHSLPEITALVRAEDFYVFGHQEIFKACVALADKNKPVDVVTVAQSLTKNKMIDDAGGESYLAELFSDAPSAGNFRHYAEVIREEAVKRRVIHLCGDLTAEAFDPGANVNELLDGAERKVLELADMGVGGESVTLEAALREEWQRIESRQKNPGAGGIPTGFVELDEILCGLRNAELVILAARPSVGKSQLALMIASYAAAECETPVLFMSLEQSRLELVERLLCCRAEVDTHHVRRGDINPDEIDRMMRANDVLGRSVILFDDTPGQNMLRISANARRMKKRYGIKLMVVDYLQLILPDDSRQPRNEQVGAISRRLKLLARELDIPILALAQLNRESEAGGGSRPKLSQLSASDNIGQDADTVILLHRQHEDQSSAPTCLVDVIVEKNRNGRRGDLTLLFQKRFVKFFNWQPEPTNPTM